MALDDDDNFITTSYSTYYNFSQTWQLQISARYIF
jgi:hypothetical protein